LSHNRKQNEQELFPLQCYAALYIFSAASGQPYSCCLTGRLSQSSLLADRLASFLFSQGVAEADVDHINLWDASGIWGVGATIHAGDVNGSAAT
jgi:hypothetical protein